MFKTPTSALKCEVLQCDEENCCLLPSCDNVDEVWW